jgi:DedD protein
MEQKLKERLVGAVVLVAVAVIFIPIILTDSPEPEAIQGSNIPEKPETNFNSRIIPVLEVDEKASITPIDTNGIQSEGNQVENKQNTMREIIVEKVISATDKSSAKESSVIKGDIKKEGGVKNNVGLSAWIIQLGSFSSGENAQSLNEKLRKAGYPSFVEPLEKNGQLSYRVRVGPEIKRSDAESLLKVLKDKMDLDGIIVSYP